MWYEIVFFFKLHKCTFPNNKSTIQLHFLYILCTKNFLFAFILFLQQLSVINTISFLFNKWRNWVWLRSWGADVSDSWDLSGFNLQWASRMFLGRIGRHKANLAFMYDSNIILRLWVLAHVLSLHFLCTFVQVIYPSASNYTSV